jgi:hypothetical protein
VLPYLPHIALMIAVLALLRDAPETVEHRAGAPPQRTPLRTMRSGRFLTVVAPMAPWVFAAPAIAFALLPSVAGADHARDGIALTAAITTSCAVAGVLIQPLARRLDAGGRTNRAATVGLLVLTLGLELGAATARAGQTWLLVPSSIVLGSAYGLCLVAGLVEVQRLADARTLAGLTAIYYALSYLGFATPYLLTLGRGLASYPVLLTITSGLALATAMLVSRRTSATSRPGPALGCSGGRERSPG